jgi:hypothetical protein
MKRKKKCRYCREWFHPSIQNYRRERSCARTTCRRQRRCEALRRWRRKNPLYPESGGVKRRRWREKKGAAYMRAYRKKHAGYVRRNRRYQKRRDEKRRFLVKRNDWNSIRREKIDRIRAFGLLVKRNDWTDALIHQIDGICDMLERPWLLVNRNDTDKPNESV